MWGDGNIYQGKAELSTAKLILESNNIKIIYSVIPWFIFWVNNGKELLCVL